MNNFFSDFFVESVSPAFDCPGTVVNTCVVCDGGCALTCFEQCSENCTENTGSGLCSSCDGTCGTNCGDGCDAFCHSWVVNIK